VIAKSLANLLPISKTHGSWRSLNWFQLRERFRILIVNYHFGQYKREYRIGKLYSIKVSRIFSLNRQHDKTVSSARLVLFRFQRQKITSKLVFHLIEDNINVTQFFDFSFSKWTCHCHSNFEESTFSRDKSARCRNNFAW
jgi:hypothetical protein